MDPRHPLISSLVCRQSDGRFVQISNRSHVKHAFLSTNSGGCGSCRNPGTGTLLGPGCSDTYGAGLNASRYYLGPADEIDPWLGAWDPRCSYFDRGDPRVSPPQDCDSRRSLTSSQTSRFNSIKNRVQIRDDDLNVANARYFYGAYYVFQREHESVRENNSRTREFQPRWNGSQWSFPNAGGGPIDGTMLRQWSGAQISSSTNGTDDGRIFVAVKVTGPDSNGIYRYEYATQ